MADEIGGAPCRGAVLSPARGGSEQEWNWWADATRGGGVWGAVGSHFVDALPPLRDGDPRTRDALTIETRPFGETTRAVTADDFASVDAPARWRGGDDDVQRRRRRPRRIERSPSTETRCHALHRRGAARTTARRTRPWPAVPCPPPGNSQGGAFGTGTSTSPTPSARPSTKSRPRSPLPAAIRRRPHPRNNACSTPPGRARCRIPPVFSVISDEQHELVTRAFGRAVGYAPQLQTPKQHQQRVINFASFGIPVSHSNGSSAIVPSANDRTAVAPAQGPGRWG
jgi:hypothetical protein